MKSILVMVTFLFPTLVLATDRCPRQSELSKEEKLVVCEKLVSSDLEPILSQSCINSCIQRADYLDINLATNKCELATDIDAPKAPLLSFNIRQDFDGVGYHKEPYSSIVNIELNCASGVIEASYVGDYSQSDMLGGSTTIQHIRSVESVVSGPENISIDFDDSTKQLKVFVKNLVMIDEIDKAAYQSAQFTLRNTSAAKVKINGDSIRRTDVVMTATVNDIYKDFVNTGLSDINLTFTKLSNNYSLRVRG